MAKTSAATDPHRINENRALATGRGFFMSARQAARYPAAR
jgi:hypothetical protein